ncbi:hypothetical protein ABEB36_008441 [Hypothenemus hampei]|uniref:Serine/threonine-protein kinase receptor n=1 Tax=Hypothenemus hampei TaxID=57062 RepID=A0ABD1ELV3_HYPHA
MVNRRRRLKRMQVRKCYCEGHCPNGQSNGTCEVKIGGMCFTDIEAEIEDGVEVAVLRYGCFPPDEGTLMQCKGNLVPHKNSKSIQCCNDTDLCNRDLQPMYTPKLTTDIPSFDVKNSLQFTVLLASITFTVSVLLLGLAFLYIRYKRRDIQGKNQFHKGYSSEKYPTMEVHGPLVGLIEKSSGTGSGLPILVQRTISRQITLIQKIGEGRYAEVWLGNWRGEKVAVKLFSTQKEQSWYRETEIYQTVLMRHENILNFISADIKGSKGWTQMLLITDYHHNGSLFDYLQNHCLDPNTLLLMAKGIASGLTYLHTEIFSTQGKLAIAHRDLKSKNILVKRDGGCCIADFGLSVKFLSDSNEIDVPPNTRAGTKRYMAPEILNQTINVLDFEAHKKTDIYALALVFWEMCRRCTTGDKIKMVDDYAVPYYDCVPSDPSYDEMSLAVCSKNIRPQLLPRWQSEEVLRTLSKLMEECWHSNPDVRLSSLRVKKTLSRLEPDISSKIV